MANTSSCVGSQNKVGQVTLLDAGFRVECPRNINSLKKKKKQTKNKNMTFVKMTREMTNLEIDCSLC